MKKLRAGILGATGMVGQRYIELLREHPWFEVAYLVASEKSAGKNYKEAAKWCLGSDLPRNIGEKMIHGIDDFESAKKSCDFVFSALDSDIAKIYEEKYASLELPVVSNSSAHRWTKDVPMLIPEINHRHIDILPIQQKNRGWKKGFIVAKPNCSLQSYLTPLYALHSQFGIKRAIITTMQAVSGAGYHGVASLDIIDNVIPYIGGEEEKTEQEPLKILGDIKNGEIVPEDKIKISAHCNRVPCLDGHMACVSVEFEKKPTQDEILSAWKNFKSMPQELELPSAPKQPIIYREEANRPQTRIDRDAGKGMAVVVGRLRECNVLHYRFVGLSHNTIRGAAGGGILNAELLKAKGYL